MPRYRRNVRPGDLVHVISRFVNREVRLTGSEERFEYLRRFGERILRSDWRCISYALMGTHVHHGMIAGDEPFEALMKSVHAPFALWLNACQGRLGPVFAGRPKSIIVQPIWTARLVAYHHNNPARANVVDSARASDWTSHRAYVGETDAPDFLDVELGLQLMGYTADERGRNAFGEYVRDRQAEPRDVMLSGDYRRTNARLREELGAAVSLAHPRTGPQGADYAPRRRATRWGGTLETIVEMVAQQRHVSSLEIMSSSRRRELVSARRLVALVAGTLGSTYREIGLQLGVSEPAVRKLRNTANDEEWREALEVLKTIGARGIEGSESSESSDRPLG